MGKKQRSENKIEPINNNGYIWTNNTGVNISVIAYDENDNKVHSVTSLKSEYQFKCPKSYSYIIIDKPHKQTLHVSIKENNSSLVLESNNQFAFKLNI